MAGSPYAVAIATLLVAMSSVGCRRASPKTSDEVPPMLVTADPVQIGTIRAFVSGTGVIVTPGEADFLVVAGEPGQVVEVSKKVGDTVKAGEILVRLELPAVHLESAARAAAARAVAVRLQNAKLVQTRVHDLFDRGAASRKEVEDADRELEQVEAEAAATREGEASAAVVAQRSILPAPFDGIVTERFHNPGDAVHVSPPDPILRLVDPKRVEVAAVVSLKDASRFGVGAAARAVAEGNPQPELLRVASRPAPEPGATALPVHLSFEHPTQLTAGTQVGVDIDAEQHSNALLVPAIAVVTEPDKTQVVFVASGDRALRRVVTTGLVDTEHVEILSGLKVGDLVVIQGQGNLKDGAVISASIQDRMKD
jgi:RND family efflux transporter MFP subunit